MCITCNNYHSKHCRTCGNLALDFRSAAARREYEQSGMCQDCQDNAFDIDAQDMEARGEVLNM